ncbi:hypothetical protein C8Q76DRAFT_790505 [Earliella scabrosa]|nr:hypothetical protein C8Q76DRAFT_790505 [Earliella scabrosa]
MTLTLKFHHAHLQSRIFWPRAPRTEPATNRKIYNVEDYTSTLEFLTMVALTTGRLLKKIPYFSHPPEIHPSLIPVTVPGNSSHVAPGTETVGQAQIVSESPKPFTLDGPFSTANAGAFGGGEPGDAEMAEAEAEEGVDGRGREADGIRRPSPAQPLAPPFPSPPPVPFPPPRPRPPQPPPHLHCKHKRHDADGVRSSAPRRLRLRRAHDVPDVPDYHARRAMASANPLRRRVLKHEAKMTRRAANRAVQRKRDAGMDVDEELLLEATFMADPPRLDDEGWNGNNSMHDMDIQDADQDDMARSIGGERNWSVKA